MTVKQALHVFHQFISQRQTNGQAFYIKVKEVDKQNQVCVKSLGVALLLLLQLGQNNFHKNVLEEAS